MSFKTDVLAGAKDVTALLPPLITIGAVAGIAGTEAGLSPVEILGMGVLFFSPVSTITTIDLLAAGAPDIVIILTALSVVVHFTILSLSIAPFFERVSTSWKWVLAYFLNTPNYALSVRRFEADTDTDIRGYYLGVVGPFWLAWQASLAAGIVFGVGIPSAWEFDFVVPLVFIGLLNSMIKTWTIAVVAVVAGVVSLVG
uniref:AzlC family ABC transporter permease n=1 Tax=Halorubrum sp. HHNYT27 TaxID=3402275 RepID=UPI003EBCEBDB